VPAVSTPDDLAARVRAAEPRAGGTRVVAVDGPSGAGKTTLAAALAAGLGVAGVPAPVVHLDDIYPGWDGLDDAVPRLLEWVLEPLAAGREPRYRRFDWPSGAYAEWHDVPVAGAAALVVEGVASGARACAPYLSLLLWVEAPRDLRFARGIERDGDAYLPYWERWAVQEEKHFAREGTRARADRILSGEGPGWR
jgi:uridine kinase